MAWQRGYSNFGYFVSDSPSSIVERVDYADDTATALVRGNLTVASYARAATGNADFGYVGGGGGDISTVDRIDYSNDNVTASPKGPLSLARRSLAATGNSNFGYFGGAFPVHVQQ